LSRPDIAAMDGYHSPQVDVAVRLNTNEAPAPPPEEFRKALAAAVAELDWHRYPDRGADELRTRLAALHSDEVPGNGFTTDQIFCANGSNEVLQTLLLTYGGPGRTSAVFEPTYALHSHISHITNTTVATGERDENFGLSIDTVRAVLDEHRPTVTFLCSPNNPTGRSEPRELVEQTLEAVANIGGLLVVDEAYGQFASWSALELVSQDVPLVVTRTFSKTWSMAAARLGYLVGPTWLVAELDKVVLPYHLDAVTQLAGTLALDHVDAMRRRVAELVERRGEVVSALAELDVDVVPSEANFILFRPRRVDGNEVWEGLLEKSVLIRNCASWERLDGCLRMTVGTSEENRAFVDALTSVLSAGASTTNGAIT
jgi:histidinol-phosphate aminotransferase